jgi:protein SCO1
MRRMSNDRWLRKAFLLCIALLGFLIVYWFWPNGREVPVLDKADRFVLEGIDGKPYDSNNKKIKLLTFFYTNCPDICPLTMQDFKELQTKLKEEGLFGSKVELLAITLDPEHDSIAVISKYARAFDADHDGWKFLRGSSQQTNEIADSYHMKYKKTSDFIAHNTTMFLIDGNNRIRALYDMASEKKPVRKEEIMKQVKMVSEENH